MCHKESFAAFCQAIRCIPTHVGPWGLVLMATYEDCRAAIQLAEECEIPTICGPEAAQLPGYWYVAFTVKPNHVERYCDVCATISPKAYRVTPDNVTICKNCYHDGNYAIEWDNETAWHSDEILAYQRATIIVE